MYITQLITREEFSQLETVFIKIDMLNARKTDNIYHPVNMAEAFVDQLWNDIFRYYWSEIIITPTVRNKDGNKLLRENSSLTLIYKSKDTYPIRLDKARCINRLFDYKYLNNLDKKICIYNRYKSNIVTYLLNDKNSTVSYIEGDTKVFNVVELSLLGEERWNNNIAPHIIGYHYYDDHLKIETDIDIFKFSIR